MWATPVSAPPRVEGFALKAGALGGGLQTLISDPDGRVEGDRAFHRHDLAASGEWIAVHYPLTNGQRTLLYGPSGFEAIADDCRNASLDLHGDLLAFAPLCSGSWGGVRNLSTGESESEGVSGAVQDIHVAGGYSAWREPVHSHKPDLVVYDRSEKRVAYRVDVASLLPPSDSIHYEFDLQPDGKVAVAYNRFGEKAKVSWFSPSEPRPHTIADHVAGKIAMARDAIALKRYPRGADAEFAVVDLSGRTLQVFDRDDPKWGTSGIDFDGSTLVWDSHRRGVRISRYPVEVDSVTERFTVVPKRFRTTSRAKGKRDSTKSGGGALLRIRLTAPARVSILLERLEGRGMPCGPAGPPPPWCSTSQRVGTLRLGRRRGTVRHRFTGALRGRRLPAGDYRAVIATRRGSRPGVRETTVKFTIVAR